MGAYDLLCGGRGRFEGGPLIISLLPSAFLAAALPMFWFVGFRFSCPEKWLRLRRRAGSHRVIVFWSFAFAPACAYVYDDYDLAVGRGFRAGVRLNTLHSCCGAVDFGLRRGHAGHAFGPGSCEWRVLLQWPWRSRWGRLSD